MKTQKTKKRHTEQSEEDVLKEPQINFQFFGSMSESGSEASLASGRSGIKKSHLTIKTG